MTDHRGFYAWHRAGLATSLSGSPAPGSARAQVPADVSLDQHRTKKVPVEIAGPGDVIGLDPAEVRRCEPHDGCPDFEPSYFPYVELRSADLPWRFTPLGPATQPIVDPEHPSTTDQQQHLQPWLALVALRMDQHTISPAGPGRLPTLTCDGVLLPDPRDAWAWAHVQVNTSDGQDPAASIVDPSKAFARILCPIRLEADQSYRACLVPTFAAGVAAAGLTTGAKPDPLGAAWAQTGTVTLPVYHSWTFGTGDAGSFETLARRLRPRSAPASCAGTVVHTDAPGWGATGRAGATVLMQGALRPTSNGTAAPEPPADPHLAANLATAVSATGTGLQLRPPLYGQDYQGGPTVVEAGTPGWFSQLNTDPRRRLAAGLAAWAVTVEQEDLSDQAWQKLSEAGIHAQPATDPALASALTGAIAARHLPAPGTSSPAASQPETARARFVPVFDEPAFTFLRSLAQEWLLPGGADVPEDSVVLLQTNPGFTEAFLIGLNHALARELAWRRYPLDPTGTMFRRFWATTPGGGDSAVPPIAEWPVESDLGSHSPNPEQMVVLLRGALLRRFPTAAVYLSASQRDGTEARLSPTIVGTLGPNSVFVGFPLTPEQAVQTGPDAPRGWSIVIQESVQHARFGLDDVPEGGATSTLDSWQDLDWGHPQMKGRTHVPVAGPLTGVTRPLSGPTPAGPAPQARWGSDAGHLAAILVRAPVRIRIPVSLWLSPPT